MALFNRSGMTQAGINLMGKAMAGATIQFTRLSMGDGEYDGEILDLQGVVSHRQGVDVTRIERNDNQCTVCGELLTSSVKQGFLWKEIGLYAMDTDGTEILYCYASSSKADYIVPKDSGVTQELIVEMVAVVGSANVNITVDSGVVFATKKEMDKVNSQLVILEHEKAENGGEILVKQINKNKGKFDQTYMTDEFLQQIAGEAPIYSIPADGGVTTVKIAEKAVTVDKFADETISAISNLNRENLFDNPLFIKEHGQWVISQHGSYDDFIKIDGFNTIKITKGIDTSNNHFYQRIFNLNENTSYEVCINYKLLKSADLRIVVFGYKDNSYVNQKTYSFMCEQGEGAIRTTFVAVGKDIVDEHRIAFVLETTDVEVWFSKPLLVQAHIRKKNFSIKDDITELREDIRNVSSEIEREVTFNPNNLNSENGEPKNWSINNLCEYSDVLIDGYRTLKVTSDGSTSTPYKAIHLPEEFQGYSGPNTIAMKVKVELKEGESYPVTIAAANISYKPGATTGGTYSKTDYIIYEDGIYEISNTQKYTNTGKIHGCFGLNSTAVTCYINQLTVTLDDVPQEHTLNMLYKKVATLSKVEKEISETRTVLDELEEKVDNLIDVNLDEYILNPLYRKIVTFNGDSICQGTVNKGGYGVIIAERNNMVYENKGIGGGTITAETYQTPEQYPDLTEPRPRHWISRTIQNMRADADYIILEGGINDYFNKIEKGSITPNYTSELDDTTFCGAFESMLKQAVLRWPGKKIGFIIIHKITNNFYPYGSTVSGKFEVYRELMLEMLNKWSIPYLDLFNCSGLNTNIPEIKAAYTKDGDGVHPNTEGYEKFYVPKIEAWMKTL